jgi:pyrroline-5-carboxylate reductase
VEPGAGINLTVLGTGNLASALVRGWVTAGTLSPAQLTLWNRTTDKATALAEELSATATSSFSEAVARADVVLLGVKPWAVAPLLDLIRASLAPSTVVVSIAAGVRLTTMAESAPPCQPLIRVLPNTPYLVSAGAAAFARGSHATDDHARLVQRLFAATGICVEVTDTQMDAVVGVAGSGPAYAYLIIEALTDGGVRMGLPRDIARQMVAQTLLGSAKMVLETGQHPMVLKDAVTTPGGTTMAALEVLEQGALRGTLIAAVRAATERSQELG